MNISFLVACLNDIAPYTAVCESGIISPGSLFDPDYCCSACTSAKEQNKGRGSTAFCEPIDLSAGSEGYFNHPVNGALAASATSAASPNTSEEDAYYSPRSGSSNGSAWSNNSLISSSSSREDAGGCGHGQDAADTWATVSISTISLGDLPALGFEDISVYQSTACLELGMSE